MMENIVTGPRVDVEPDILSEGCCGSQDCENKSLKFSDLSLEDVRKMNENFIKERNWDQFHSPRNVLLAIVGEVGELSEIFQWKGEVSEGLPELTEDERKHVGEEISDIFIYLVDFASRCHIDLSKAVIAKMAANAKKYPVDKAYGQANKYTDYQ
ncbi:dCTP pyrophosphatase 1 [Biomphalaria glabrata]|nr:dCTP pyrophosphatase 1-like [Biomphalaria glabrata]